ncbi:MAG: NAD(P)/FAD-dependent oxidoreductase [Bacteroidales bacterium]|nr:NAD(P)/FAD-dependent oxidoreductase [Bacteroidales bacterium]
MSKYDIIIIGSGLGGLQCGYILSKRGYKVLILERQAQPGGCMQSYRRHGENLDTGMHYVGGLGVGDCLYSSFKYMGLMDLPWVHLDPSGFDRVTIGDRTFRYAEGHEAFIDTLVKDFPTQRAGLEKYAATMKEVGGHLFDAIMPRDVTDFFTTSLFGASTYDFLHETFSDELLINVLSGSSLKMELAKETLPLYNFAQANNSFVQGSYRLKGDGNLIVYKLLDSIRAFGGELICNAEVEELIEKDGKLVAARCSNGETYEADLFISNAHPAVTCDLVKESTKLKKVYRNRIHRLENTYGMYTVSLVLKPGQLKYFNWNQYIYVKPNVWDYFKQDGPVSGLLISCRVPETAELQNGFVTNDPDARILDILTPLPWEKIQQWEQTKVGHRGEEYKAFKERLADECIALSERFIPGLHNMVEARFSSTPLTYRDYTLTPNGSSYGVRKDYHNPMMTLLSAKTPIPNLLLTGQSLTLHGLLGVTMTSLFTVAEIIGKEEAWKITQTE